MSDIDELFQDFLDVMDLDSQEIKRIRSLMDVQTGTTSDMTTGQPVNVEFPDIGGVISSHSNTSLITYLTETSGYSDTEEAIEQETIRKRRAEGEISDEPEKKTGH